MPRRTFFLIFAFCTALSPVSVDKQLTAALPLVGWRLGFGLRSTQARCAQPKAEHNKKQFEIADGVTVLRYLLQLQHPVLPAIVRAPAYAQGVWPRVST